ncbi:predicted protein [Uncinocarpus reesii 1704]|uniref:Uncharacterized protein n=1 Tax=Uncinocarpus reesii (strain UAMH 1704) TaxID=336963 RepID=C4JTQ8_UNCRE|nr:uncharacterized protein UREG_05847 [Uncinocarpus reesii 1704]EEP81005.1 predicted protein [Uncinocarpus reesii 1704]
MCYPKDEDLLKKHCAFHQEREKRAFWLVSAMLAAFTLAVAGLIVFHDCVQKREKTPKREGKGPLDASKRPWASRIKCCFKRRREAKVIDLEEFSSNPDKASALAQDEWSSIKGELDGDGAQTAGTRSMLDWEPVTFKDGTEVVPVMPRAQMPRTEKRHIARVTFAASSTPPGNVLAPELDVNMVCSSPTERVHPGTRKGFYWSRERR